MSAGRERLVRVAGKAGLSRAALRLITLMSGAALAVVIGLPLLTRPGRLDLGWFALVVGLIVAANLFGLRMRIGATIINVAWGEAVLIVGFTLLPAPYLPLAVGLGILLGMVLRRAFVERGDPLESVRAIAALTFSAGLAAMVVMAFDIDTGALGPEVAGVLALSAFVYLLSTLVLLAFYLRVRDGHPIMGVIWGALRGSPIMIVGNLALGLLAALLWQTDGERIFLLVLPPLLWLMHQLYSHRLREDEERRTWRAFAVASRSLHRLDEVAVAQEGVRSACALFAVRRVELAVFGSQITYARDAIGSDVEVHAGIAPSTDGDNVTRMLEVAGGPVGELTLMPARVGAWSTNDQHRLAAFGDALAAALHDAATHSALRELYERTTYDSLHDPLTRLLNRDALLDRGHNRLRGCPADQPVALILFDLDNFKTVNDTLGHLAGDELLQRTAARLAEDAEPTELTARLGGDEFALLMTELPVGVSGDIAVGVDPLEAAVAVALRRARALTANLAVPTEVAGVTLSVEVTAGVVVATAGPVDLIELLRRADIALYQAKESGVRTMAYQAGRDDKSTDRLALVAEMQAALAKDDQLSLVMLPTVDLPTGAPIGVETLIRWQHPRRGPLLPKDFIRAVEASDLLGQFTRYVLDRSLAVAAELAEAGLRMPVSVNLSPRSLLDPQLPADLAELLRRHGVAGEDLILEIIETVVLSPLSVTDQVLHGLRAMGVRFAVDDFGTGYSSLTFLTRIAVDELKIDRTFVARMAESKEAGAIVRAVIDLGQRLGIRVVAEGVETAQQRAALVELGCDAGQGFHFAKPVPTGDIARVVERLRTAVRPVRPVKLRKIG